MNKKLSIQNESKTSVAKARKENLSSFHRLDKNLKRTKIIKSRPTKTKANKILSK